MLAPLPALVGRAPRGKDAEMPPELSLAQRRPGWLEHVPQAWRASLAS